MRKGKKREFSRSQATPKSLENLYTINRILHRFRIRSVLSAVLHQWLWTVSLHLVLLGLAALMAARHPLSSTVPTVIACSYFVYLLVPSFFLMALCLPRYRLVNLARRLDKDNPRLYDAFQTNLSLGNHSKDTLEKLDRWYTGYLKEWRGPNLKLFSKPSAVAFCTALILFGVMGVISRDKAIFLKASFLPLRHRAQIPKLFIQLEAERQVVGVGDTAVFRGTVTGRVPGQRLYAYLNENSAVNKRFPLEFEEGRAKFSVGPLSQLVAVFFAGENGRSKTVRVEVVPRPYLAAIRAIVEPPAYAGLPRDTLLAGMTSFSVLPGSRVVWRLVSQRPLQSLVWRGVFPVTSKNPDSVHTDTLGPGQTFTVSKIFSRLPYLYRILLEDGQGIRDSFPLVSRIGLRKDAPPEVVILRPEEGEQVPRNNRLPLAAMVKDDFGVKKLKLRWRVSSDGILKDSSVIDVSPWLKSRRSGYFDLVWDLTALDLRPDNVLAFSLIACDNNRVSGSRCTESATRRVRFPSIQEIISDMERKEQLALSSLKSAMERQKNVALQVQRARRHGEEKPLLLSDYERRRILIHEPEILHRDSERALKVIRSKLDSLPSIAGRRQLDRALKESEKALRRARARVPSESQLQKGTETQLRVLETLHEGHRSLEKKMGTTANRLEEKALKSEKAVWHKLRENLEHQLQNQRDLKSFLSAQDKEQKLAHDLKKHMQQEQTEVVQDIDKAVKDLENFIRESVEKNLFTDGLLEKMEKVHELLAEVLPDSLLEMLQKKMEGEEVSASALQEGLKNLIEQGESLEGQLNRAIGMLENLRDLRKLEAWRQRTEELAQREGTLEKDVISSRATKRAEPDSGLEKRQEKIRLATQALTAEIKTNARRTRGWEKLSPLPGETAALNNMKQAEQRLRPAASGDLNRAARFTAEARKGLETMAGALAGFASAMESKSNSINIGEIENLVNESLRLSQVQLSMGRDKNGRRARGWHSATSLIYSNLAQVARWMQDRIRKISVRNSLVSPYLLAQSAQLANGLKAASLEVSQAKEAAALKANHNVTRELLKLLNLANSMPAGSGGQSGGEQGRRSGKNQGEPNLASRLQGLSGKQLAVNRATSQLLKAILAGRRRGGRGESPQGIANRQGRMGEKLESLAESAGEGPEGAAAKLRRLAEEARTIERALRREKLTPELEARQERFKARLLETARSVKERGFGNKREGLNNGARHGPAPASAGVPRSNWMRILEVEKQRAANLRLNSVQRQAVDNFYEELIIR